MKKLLFTLLILCGGCEKDKIIYETIEPDPEYCWDCEITKQYITTRVNPAIEVTNDTVCGYTEREIRLYSEAKSGEIKVIIDASGNTATVKILYDCEKIE